MKSEPQIDISELTPSDASNVINMIKLDEEIYRKHFSPFALDANVLKQQLLDTVNDRYWRIRVKNNLAGLFMLRGFDNGYIRPSFGVYIKQEYSGIGLSQLALRYAISWCYINNVNKLMLKVDTQNINALRIYRRHGFTASGFCSDTGQQILEKILN